MLGHLFIHHLRLISNTAYIRMCMHMYVCGSHTRTYVHTYVCMYALTYVHTYVCTVYTYVYELKLHCVPPALCAYVYHLSHFESYSRCMYVRTYVHTYVRMYVCLYIHMYMSAYICA